MFSNIMVAYDGSEPSKRALKSAVEFACMIGKPLRTVSVVDQIPEYITGATFGPIDTATMDDIISQRDAYAEGLVKEVHDIAAASGCEVTSEVAIGSVVDVIVDAVKRHQCDLLVIGLRAHPGLVERLMPKTGHTIAERAPCSVLGVR